MEPLSVIMLSAVVLIVVVAVAVLRKKQKPPVEQKKVDLGFRKKNGLWQITDASGNAVVQVRKGDSITWQAPDISEIDFQFCVNTKDYFEPERAEDQLEHGYTKKLLPGETLNLKVHHRARSKTTIIYSAYILQSGNYAVGGSPPKIFIL